MQKMKNYLIAMALLLTVGFTPMSAQTTNDEKAVVAYSDTTGIEGDADSAYVTITRGGKNVRLSVPADWIDDDEFNTVSHSIQIDGFDGLLSTINRLVDDDRLDGVLTGEVFGALGIVLLIAFVVLFIFVILPIIIVALVLRHIVRQHNRSVDDALQGPPPASPEGEGQYAATSRYGNQSSPSGEVGEGLPADYQWQRGVRNTSIGVGIALLFKIMGLNGLVGIGVLIAILGIGQMVIAKTSK